MKKVLEFYSFELTERIARFYMHLNAIKDQFYVGSDKVIDKLTFIKSYEQCLDKALLAIAEQLYMVENQHLDDDKLFDFVRSNMQLSALLTDLHEEWLSHLPRPSEPIELRRFCRVIEKQVFNFQHDWSRISVYINEKIGDETYAIDPLSNYKAEKFNNFLETINSLLSNLSNSYEKIEHFIKPEHEFAIEPMSSQRALHITISRIDASNPCHWPLLSHEVAHNIMNQSFSQDNDIEIDFKKYLNQIEIGEDSVDVQLPCMGEIYSDNIDLKSWLTEVWCDLVACLSMGYTYWFAQFSAFLNVPTFTYNQRYPPILFRLYLIKLILKHRFSRNIMEEWEDMTNLCEEVVEKCYEAQGYLFWQDDKTIRLMQCFVVYFTKHLFQEKEGEIDFSGQLNDNLKTLVKYTKSIDLEVVKQLLVNLQLGLPIPSVTSFDKTTYIERPALIQEILCVASIFRNTSLKDEVIEGLVELRASPHFSSHKNQIEAKFKRFDQAILRSIQVSEWFDLYDLNDTYKFESQVTFPGNEGRLLVDHQIVDLIINRELNIVPIFSLKSQLGTISLDIRLGTSFQLFSPNEYGVIDFANVNTITTFENASKKKDLDFKESLILMPNQFILGHSMEYLKLPSTVAARLEGRSSFARLGIQIHMTAGSVDPGFEGVLTFEIYNAGHSPVRLYPGMRIGQLLFSQVSQPVHAYSDKHSAKYRGLLEHHFSRQGLDYEIGKINPSKTHI